MKAVKEKVVRGLGVIKKEVGVLDKKSRDRIHEVLEEFGSTFNVLYEAATRDEKTGLYNYRFFESVFQMEIDMARREKEKLSLIGIDIDFFKKINDTHGHLIGDEILVELAKVLREHLRDHDLISRFGGEEFFVLLPGEDKKSAKIISERLRESLWKLSAKLKKYSITISVGVTEFKAGDDRSKMMMRADGALYKAKEDGRDRVEVL